MILLSLLIFNYPLISGNSEEWVTKQKKVRPEKKAVQQEAVDTKSKRSTSKTDRGRPFVAFFIIAVNAPHQFSGMDNFTFYMK